MTCFPDSFPQNVLRNCESWCFRSDLIQRYFVLLFCCCSSLCLGRGPSFMFTLVASTIPALSIFPLSLFRVSISWLDLLVFTFFIWFWFNCFWIFTFSALVSLFLHEISFNQESGSWSGFLKHQTADHDWWRQFQALSLCLRIKFFLSETSKAFSVLAARGTRKQTLICQNVSFNPQMFSS